MSTIDNYTYGWVLRFLLGIVSGPVQASCLSAIGDYFGPNQRGAAVGYLHVLHIPWIDYCKPLCTICGN